MKAFIILVLLFLTLGCSSPAVRNERYAISQGFTHLDIRGGDFTHTVYLNRQREHSLWHVYIGGDGSPWSGRYTIAPDPTVDRPLMLRLMVKDSSPAIYLGRPCYQGMVDEAACRPWVWTHGRYSEAVVASMAAALEKLIERYQIDELALIGHSGGGTLAILLAERIQQTRMLITIAGNLDIRQWTLRHDYSPLTGSLNPADRPCLSQSITQFHFTGKQDTNVSPEPIQRLLKKCPGLNHIQVDEAGHESGWDSYFCQLLLLTGGRCLPADTDS